MSSSADEVGLDVLLELMDLPVKTDLQAGLVWHYTDLAGLLGILSTDTLWASASGLLNDSQEMRHGRRVVREAFDMARPGMTGPQHDYVESNLARAEREVLGGSTFVLCASTVDDSLSQWRAYAGGSGYALGLDTADRLDLLQIDEVPDARPGESPFVSPWHAVLYADEKKATTANKLIEGLADLALTAPGTFWSDLVASFAPPAYGAAISRMKHSGFEDEREVRIVATAGAAERFYHFRVGPYGPTPFVKLTGVPESTGVTTSVKYEQPEPHKLPVRAIRIGPSPHASAAEEGLRSALVRYGYPDVEIKRSGLPFR